MKDERGRRERANNGDRDDRADNPQSNNDAQAGSNPDDSMFETFGVQGMPIAPYPSDVCPPVLMPLPGAG